MRLDKFLKVSRIIKRRTLAKEVCDRKSVKVNERLAKAGTEIKKGDIIQVSLGSRRLKVRVVELRETVSATKAAELYELIEDCRIEQE